MFSSKSKKEECLGLLKELLETKIKFTEKQISDAKIAKDLLIERFPIVEELIKKMEALLQLIEELIEERSKDKEIDTDDKLLKSYKQLREDLQEDLQRHSALKSSIEKQIEELESLIAKGTNEINI